MSIACYKDYTLHIDPPAIPVPVCWWPFEVGATNPWPDTAVPGLMLDVLSSVSGVVTVASGAGKVGVQSCRVDSGYIFPAGATCELSQTASTPLLSMSLDGFTMTGWIAPQNMIVNDLFGMRYRAYVGVQVDPFPLAALDVYLQWSPTVVGTGRIEIGLIDTGVGQIFQLITPVPLAVAWHFFVFIYDRIAGKIRFSIDNAALTTSTDTYTQPPGWTTGAVVYQTQKSSPGTSILGFDEVNYFNSILNAAEIDLIYNSGIGTTYP